MLKNKYTKGNICTSFALSLFLILSMPIGSKATTGGGDFQSSNPLYINILNFTMPFVKSLASSTDENAQLNYSLKEMLLEKAGLDINNPLSVVAREFSLIKSVDDTVAVQESNNSIIINPFKLNENNIIKISQNNSNDSSQNNLIPPATAVSEIYNPNLKKTLDSSKPEVFIYHSHTTEGYKPGPQDNWDLTKSVVAVGDIIQNELQNNYGIATIHDKTVHNAIYTEAYARSGDTVNKYLSKYKDFKLIIDLHRDASAGSNPKPVSVTLNNKSMARVEFVIGTANKNYQQNLSLTRKLINISQGLFPGLVRMASPNDNGVYYWHSYFNQNKSANATLLEVGNEINTLDEAKTTGYYIARIIAEYINGKH